MKKAIVVIAGLLALAFALPQKQKIRIFIAGDSTAAIKETRSYPETGWGMPFVYFWDSTVTVVNRARNGRSTRSFMEEGLWKTITDEAQPGDYILVQFGHNDEVPTKKTATTETEFRDNLKRYVKDTRDRKAIPVLITPVARRKFDSLGHVVETHEVYAQIVRDVAAEQKVILFDLDRKSQVLYQQFGVEHSRLLFLQLKPGEHPNYPGGKDDNTHFNELGARLIAQLVMQDIREQIPELAERLVKPAVKKQE